MDRFVRNANGAGSQRGYALLMMVFFVALVVITVSAATTTFLTQERREKEQEMIWRGQQYVRGIHLYYQKMHRFPMQLEDLYQPKTGIRFMRKAYKDPLNTADGSWRLIYVGPNGQIIGSLQQPAVVPNPMAPPQRPFTDSLSTPPPAANDPLSSSSTMPSSSFSSSFSSSGAQSLPGGSASNSPNSINNGEASGGSGSGFGGGNNFSSGNSFGNGNTFSAGASGASSSSSLSAQDPGMPQTIAQPLDSSAPVIGNAIIGVGSKVNRTSIIWYEKAKDYRHFEFIWKAWTQDPLLVTPNP